jgi:hypothetical protein
MITSFIIPELGSGEGPILDEPNTQLPATIQQAEVTANQRALNVVPALIAKQHRNFDELCAQLILSRPDDPGCKVVSSR